MLHKNSTVTSTHCMTDIDVANVQNRQKPENLKTSFKVQTDLVLHCIWFSVNFEILLTKFGSTFR